MQAPHSPAPQPNLVPVSFSPSRSTQSSGVLSGASVDAVLPFTVKSVAIISLPASRRPRRPTGIISFSLLCQRGLDPIRRERQFPQPLAGGISESIGDRRRSRTLGSFAGAERALVRAVDQFDLDL